MNDVALHLVFCTLMAGSAIVAIRAFHSPLSPSSILCLVWACVALLKLSIGQEFALSYTAVLTTFALTAVYAIGELIGTAYLVGTKQNPRAPEVSSEILRTEPPYRLVVASLGILSLLGAVLYFHYVVNYFGGLTEALFAGWAVRGAIASGDFSPPLLSRMLTLFCYPACVLAATGWLLSGRFSSLYLLPFIAVILFGMSQNGRAGILIVLSQIALVPFWRSYVSTGHWIRLAYMMRFLNFFLLALVVFIGGQAIRQGSELEFDALAELGRKLLVYVFGGISGFSMMIEEGGLDVSEYSSGTYSFNSLLALFGLANSVAGVYEEFVQISPYSDERSNIYTAYMPLIQDFGIPGAVVFLAVCGALGALIFANAKSLRPAYIALYIALASYLIHVPVLPLTLHNSFLLSAALPAVVLASRQFRFPRRLHA